MSKESSGDGPKGNSKGNSGNSKGSSNGSSGGSKGNSGDSKGSGGSQNTKNSSSSNTKGSGGNSGGLGNVGWGGGDKGPNLGVGSYNASTGFGKGDTGSAFGGSFSEGSKGNSGDSKGNSKAPTKATQATSSMDAAFQNFRPDTVHNTQVMNGQLYTKKDTQSGWVNHKTGQEIGGTQLDRLAHFDGLKQENMNTRGYGDLQAIKNWFNDVNPFGEEEKTTGPSPLGGWASYGGAVPGTEDPRGVFTKIGDAFTKFGWGIQDAPLKTLSDLASNPMVATTASFLGGLPAIAAIRATSAVDDLVKGVMTPAEAAQDLAKTAITSTPLGNALGETKHLAAAAVSGLDKMPGAIGGFAGGKVGTGAGEAIGAALANNPYGASIGAMLGGSIGSFGGSKLGAASYGQPQSPSTSKPSDKGTQKSPLVSRGDTQVAKNTQQATEADPMKYIREMQLPFYGPNYQYNPYGFPNTMIGA